MSKSIFFNALKWSTGAELASKAIQPIIFIVLARLLSPEDYGVMAAATMIISLTQIFWDAGMTKALIQRQSTIAIAYHVAFWINISLSLVFASLLFLCSDLIASVIFKDMRVSPVLECMTLQIVLGALGSVHTALLQKEMKFNKLFWARLISIAVPGIFSIPLALSGMSYWAIVVGTLIGQAFQVIFLWVSSGWRPTFSFSNSVAKDLLQFGSWVGLTGLLVWFYLWADSFVVGAYLGTRQLGLFRTANTVVLLLFDVLFAPLLPVLYSYYSTSTHDRIFAATSTIIRIIAMVAIPLSFLLFNLATPASDFFFGKKWDGVGYIISILGLMRGYGWLVGINGEVYRAVGKPHYETLVYALSCLVFLVGYIISIQIGFKEFVYTRLGLGMVSLIPHFYFFKKVLKNPISPILRTIIISTFAGLIALLVTSIIPHFTQPILYLTFVPGIGILVIVVVLGFFEYEFLKSLIGIIAFKKRTNG